MNVFPIHECNWPTFQLPASLAVGHFILLMPVSYASMGKGTINGIILNSVVATDGKLDQFRVVQSWTRIDRASMEWQLEPAKDAKGNSVPVRILFELSHQTT
jgi:hypothetical protein